jgi:DNA-directed RNA polymerase subunit RPC12/RpoP
MARYYYRCSKCRTRNVFPRDLEDYRRARKCKACGHRRFYVDKERVARQACSCDGGLIGRTGSIPHRPGSAGCLLNPLHPYHRARLMGAPEEVLLTIQAELAFEGEGGRIMGKDDPCPF